MVPLELRGGHLAADRGADGGQLRGPGQTTHVGDVRRGLDSCVKHSFQLCFRYIYLSRTELTARWRSADLGADAVGKVADEILALKNMGSKNSC